METKANDLWLDFKSHFLKQRGQDQPSSRYWLESVTPLKIEKRGAGFRLVLQTPSDLHKKWLKENCLDYFRRHFNKSLQKTCHLQLEVVPALPKKQKTLKNSFFKQKHFFNSLYTFENFIVGGSNHLAYGACQAISKNKKAGESLNPLFIYGPSGLGKTHLLNAIGQENLKNHSSSRIVYLSAERFLNEYINAIQNRQMDRFRQKFRKNCDLLLMDDIQIISKGRGVQEEFFHTFNELYNKKAQIVICCDQSPGNISLLENRIKTRLEGGLMVDIAYPDKETRLAILKDKARQKNLSLSSQSLEQISLVCKSSIREMEGVLNKIKIMTELFEKDLCFEEIKKILLKTKKALNMDIIQKSAAQAFKISVEELKSSSRKKQIVRARQAAIYLIRLSLKKSLNDIALAFGKKDHTTILSSVKKAESLKNKDEGFRRVLEALQEEIQNNY